MMDNEINIPIEVLEGTSAEDIYWSDMCEMWQEGGDI